MSDAINNPVKRQYNRRESHTGDMAIGQKEDIDVSLDSPILHGEALGNIAGDNQVNDDYMRELAFMEEPVTVRVEENSRSDYPETHVPVQVNGRGAEVMMNGRWTEVTWIPVNTALVMKRKFVEVLARSKSDAIRTVHDDANVEKPRNTINRRTSHNYPLSIIKDDNPRGHEWLSRIMQSH